MGTLGQLHGGNTAAVGVDNPLIATAQVKIYRHIRDRIVVFIQYRHIQNAQGILLIYHHLHLCGVSKTAVVGYGQGDSISAFFGVLFHRFFFVRGRAVAEIPMIALNGQIITGRGSVKELFRTSHHIGRLGNDSCGRCVLVYIHIFHRYSLGCRILQHVHRFYLVGKGGAFFCSNSIGKGVAAAGARPTVT